MPNWVRNDLKVQGTADDIKAFIEKVKTPNSDFDFNAIVPMPKTLNMVEGGKQEEAIVAYLTQNCEKPFTEEIRRKCVKYGVTNTFGKDDWQQTVYSRAKETIEKDGEDMEYSFASGAGDGEPMLTLYDAGKIYVDNIDKYGTSSWYHWSIKFWGTKWDASDPCLSQDSDTEVCVEFETAWSAPVPIFEKLVELFPDMNMTLKFADEDLGSNCGILSWEDGTADEWYPGDEDDEALKFACSVWGFDYDEIKAEREEWEDDEDGKEE